MESSDSDDDLLFLITAGILYSRIKKKKKRKFWMHPVTNMRKSKGFFYTLYKELIHDTEKFFNFTRMSRETFQELLLLINDQCSKKDSTMRECIPVEEKLVKVSNSFFIYLVFKNSETYNIL